jgi:hypothetical protein
MSSDSTNENYPVVQICDECYEKDMLQGEDSHIVNSGEFDPSFGTECSVCGKTLDEERAL